MVFKVYFESTEVYPIYLSSYDIRVEDLRSQIGLQVQDQDAIKWEDQELVFNGKVLRDGRTLGYFNINDGDTITLTRRSSIFCLDEEVLAPRYDCDFTHLKEDGTVYMRGGWAYQRPYGWNRIALKVEKKYESDDWLGTGRHNACWAVSYHGTTKLSAEEISSTKYDLSKGKRFAFGVGIYSTPEPKIAEKYATAFRYKERNYKVILQNRVNMMDTEYITGVNYFLTKHEENIRPYGILYKEV